MVNERTKRKVVDKNHPAITDGSLHKFAPNILLVHIRLSTVWQCVHLLICTTNSPVTSRHGSVVKATLLPGEPGFNSIPVKN